MRIGDELRAAYFVSHQIFIPDETVERSPEFVRSAFRYGVDPCARESSFANVEWRNRHLHLFDRIEGDRLGIRLTPGGRIVEPEWIIKVRSIQRDIIEEPVPSAEAEISITPGIEPGQIPGASLNR